jgi:DNA repair protein RadC
MADIPQIFKRSFDKFLERAVELSVDAILVAAATGMVTAVVVVFIFFRRLEEAHQVLLYETRGILIGTASVVCLTLALHALKKIRFERHQRNQFATKTKGYLDFNVEFLASTNRQTSLLLKMAKQQQWITKRLEVHTRRVDQVKGKHPRKAQKLAAFVAKDVNYHSARFESYVADYEIQITVTIQCMKGWASVFPNNLDAQQQLYAGAAMLIPSVHGGKIAQETYKNSLSGIFGITEVLNDAVKRNEAITERLVQILNTIEKELVDIANVAAKRIQDLKKPPL